MRRAVASHPLVALVVLAVSGSLLAGTSPPAAAVPGDARAVAITASGTDGYTILDEAGGVFTFGAARFSGSVPGLRAAGDPIPPVAVADLAVVPGGYLVLDGLGGVFAFGAARYHGSIPALRAAGHPIPPVRAVAIATSGTDGYTILDEAGGVFAFGADRFSGSVPGLRAAGDPIPPVAVTDLAVVPGGYLVLDGLGGVFAFGAARYHGSIPALRAAGHPIPPVRAVAIAASGTDGYTILDEAGGVFAFGADRFSGSVPGLRAAGDPIPPVAVTDLAVVPGGYLVLDGLGGVFAFGAARYHGSVVELRRQFATPDLAVAAVLDGLTVPWDVGFAPDGSMFLTERPGRLSAVVGGQRRVLAAPADVYAVGEAGMMGLAVDPAFAQNRIVHVCQAYSAGGTRDVRVYRWRIADDWSSASRVRGPTVSGIPLASTGRHAGCRPRFGPDGFLWIGTGDAADGRHPQDPSSLGGKVLRVVAGTGAPAPGNGFPGVVHTIGHRNVQGLAARPGTAEMYSVEHGPDRDDEVNRLVAGGNYGWDPRPGYDESVPMTDTAKFPHAIPAVWSSGAARVAPSGAVFLSGSQWGSWDGALALAALRGSELRVITLSADGGRVVAEDVRLTQFGRLRTPVIGPDGALYVTTSNGGGRDVVLRVAPR